GARRADARSRRRRRSPRARIVHPPPAARADCRAPGTLNAVEDLRERALADGWRKLVVDGVTATPVDLARGPALKVVDGAHTETVDRSSWPERLDALLADARNVHLLAPDGDLHARRTKKGRWLVSRGRPSSDAAPSGRHDRGKQHPLPADHPLFRATKISRDKERQVQHYVELLRPLPIWERDRIRVVDAGCGKAYMSLALVAYGREVGSRVDARLRRGAVRGVDDRRLRERRADRPARVASRVRYRNRRGDRRRRPARCRRDRARAVLPPRARRADRHAREGRAASAWTAARPPGGSRDRRAARRAARDRGLPRRGDGV